MSATYLSVDPARFNIQKLTKLALELQPGAVFVLPTDTNYELTCRLGDTSAISRIKQLRQLSSTHLLTLLLPSFQLLGKYAIVNNNHFRTLKHLVPGPYSFVLPATKAVPNAFAYKKRRTIGVRIPDNKVLQAFQTALSEPLIGCSLKIPSSDTAVSALHSCLGWIEKIVDLVIDCGELNGGQTTVLDMSGNEITLLRAGSGDASFLLSNAS